MSIKRIYICDRCGKEIDQNIPSRWSVNINDYVVCEDCKTDDELILKGGRDEK